MPAPAQDERPPPPPPEPPRAPETTTEPPPETATETAAEPAPEPPSRPPPPADTSEAPAPAPSPPSAPPAPTGPPATQALVLAVVALVLCVTIIVPVVALVVALGARRSGLRLATAAVVLSLVALVAGVVIDARLVTNAVREDGVKYSELRPGDCLEKPGERFVRAKRVDCAEPHDLEVFALVTDPAPRGARYPGPEILEREATVACLPQFQTYVGIPFEQSELQFTGYVPTERNWEEHNRLLVCTLAARTGRLTGTVKDARR
jgi:hypothetical protein